MRRRKSGPIAEAEKLRLRERRGLLDSRVRESDMPDRARNSLHFSDRFSGDLTPIQGSGLNSAANEFR